MDRAFYGEYYEIEGRHWWFVGRRAVLLRVLRDCLPQAEHVRILDVGCGTGTMLGYLSEFGQVQGVDASESAIAFCRERGLENVRHVPDGALPFPDRSFELVTAFDVIEHIEDDGAALRDLRRLIAPGGALMLSVPAYSFLWGRQDEISHHKRRYTAPDLQARLTAAGFTVERLTYFNTLLFPPIAAVRLLARLRGSDGQLRSDFTMNAPGRLNTALGRLFAVEARLLGRTRLPFGVSILAFASNRG